MSKLLTIVVIACGLLVCAFADNEQKADSGSKPDNGSNSNESQSQIKPEVGQDVLILYADFVKVAGYSFYLKTGSKDEAMIKKQQEDVEKILERTSTSATKSGDTEDAKTAQELNQQLGQTQSTDHSKLMDLYQKTEGVIVKVIDFKLKNNKF